MAKTLVVLPTSPSWSSVVLPTSPGWTSNALDVATTWVLSASWPSIRILWELETRKWEEIGLLGKDSD